MTVAALKTLAHMNVNNGTIISQITEARFNPGIQLIRERIAGQAYRSYTARARTEGVLSAGTTQISDLLDVIGMTGLSATSNLLTTWWQALIDGGVRGGSSTHTTVVCANGMVIPTSISVGEGEEKAKLMFEVHGRSTNGTTDPWVETASQSLAGTVANNDGYVLGPTKINGTEVTGITNLEINFGITLHKEYNSGREYPEGIFIVTVDPEIRITCKDFDPASAGLTGVAQGATDSIVYLRALTRGVSRVADATGGHISFSLDDGYAYVDEKATSESAPGTVQLVYTVDWDQSVNPLVYAANAAIS